ncbi:hypothetical protein FACS1894132_00710 [Clostridia bacterium]|nr:hypothetical protein FACS1894132_00710 [Clostridia bacterium]
MTRQEYIRILDDTLKDLDLIERSEAIRYYEEIFDGAEDNHENIEHLIEKLGSPYDAAETIKRESGMVSTISRNGRGENREEYSRDRYAQNESARPNDGKRVYETVTKPNVAAIVFAIIGFPIWIGLLVAVWAIAFSVIIALGAILVSFMAVALAFLVVGFVNLFTATAVGFMVFGLGLVFTALSLALLKPISVVIKYCAVGVGVGTANIFKALFTKKTVITGGAYR